MKNISIKKITYHLFLSLLILINLTCTQPQSVITAKLGSSLNNAREIENTSLHYEFSKIENPQKSKNIFDNIYFSGSIICFHFAMKNSLFAQTVHVQFVNPQTNETTYMDSIKIHEKNISGFISVGGALEFFYKSDIDKHPPKDHYANKKINFIIRLTVSDNSKKIDYDLPGYFSLSFN